MTNLQQQVNILDASVGIVRFKFELAYLSQRGGAGREEFYCGITNDLERRKREHNVVSFVCTHKCDSFFTAKEVERKLHSMGFNTLSLFVWCHGTLEFRATLPASPNFSTGTVNQRPHAPQTCTLTFLSLTFLAEKFGRVECVSYLCRVVTKKE